MTRSTLASRCRRRPALAAARRRAAPPAALAPSEGIAIPRAGARRAARRRGAREVGGLRRRLLLGRAGRVPARRRA